MASDQRRPAKRGGWRKDVKPTAQERTGPVRGWRKEKETAGPVAPGWSKRQKFGVLCGGLFLTFAALIFALYLLRPPKKVALVLVGAGYEQNLDVPANVYGWHGLEELVKFAQDPTGLSWWSQGKLSLKRDTAVRLKRGDHWESILDLAPKEKTLIVCLAMHGGADPNGPYLLYDDSDLSEEKREDNLLRVSAVIDALAKQPDDQRKVLILDATQVPADWDQGLLHNDFARGLAGLKDKIEKVPNLVVISASGPDQRSWVSEKWGQTVFSHYIVEGLKGAADPSSTRLTVGSLYDYVKKSTQKWSQDKRDAFQEPVALGIDKNRNMELFRTDGNYKPAPTEDTPAAIPADLGNAWKEYQDLAEAQVPRPWVYTPHLWRQYEKGVLRYEQLLLAGDKINAQELREKLNNWAAEIRRAAQQDLGSAHNSLAMAHALALPLAPYEEVKQKLDELWRLGKPAERQALIQGWDQKLPDEPSRRRLRFQLSGLLVERAFKAPDRDLAKATDLLRDLTGKSNERPIEAHFMAMLGTHLDKDQRPDAADLKLALQVRWLAENVALAVPAQDTNTLTVNATVYPYSEQVFPWIRKKVADADQKRRSGEDYLFATRREEYTQARDDLREARRLYLDAQKDADVIRSALAVRDEVLATLPAYSHWLADRWALDDVPADLVKDVEALWTQTHALAQGLEAANPEATNLQKLCEQAEGVRKEFERIAQLFDTSCERLRQGQVSVTQRYWHNLHDALAVPRIKADVRLTLLDRIRTVSAGLENVERPSDAATLEGPDVARAVRERGWRQARMALAVLGENWFDDSTNFHDRKGQAFDAIATDAKAWPGNESWGPSVTAAGNEVGVRCRRLPGVIATLTKDTFVKPLDQAARELARADRLARLVDGALATQLAVNPAAEARKVQLHNLLIGQAERTRLDHWWGDEQGAKPYYEYAGLRYVNDARQLVDGDIPETDRKVRLRDVTREENDLHRPGDLVPPERQRIDVTSEHRLDIPYVLRPNPRGWVPRGHMVLWAEVGPSLTRPTQGREVREVQPEAFEAMKVAFDVVELKPPVPLPRQDESSVTVHGFYRGQVVDQKLPVVLHRAPNTVWTDRSAENAPAGLAVRAEPAVFDRFSSANSAVVIVLDCSGSMAYPQRIDSEHLLQADTPCKFKDALDGLQKVLQKMEPGTTVSVWVFSDKGGGDVNDSIREIYPPTKWTGNQDQLDGLMGKLRPPALQPWNFTPLVRAMWKVKNEAFKDVKGFKTMIVLTDGADSEFEKDTQLLNLHPKIKDLPRNKRIPAFLEAEFKDVPVKINLVGFQVAGDDDKPSAEAEKEMQDQFGVLQKKLGGHIYTSRDTNRLASDLRKAMQREMKFYIERDDGKDLNRSAGYKSEEGWRITRDDQDNNPLAPLDPGRYTVRLEAGGIYRQFVRLDPGDYLVATLRSGQSNLSFERAVFGHNDQAKSQRNQNWLLSAQRNQYADNPQLPGAVEMLMALENEADRSPGRSETLQQPKPRAVWFEISGPNLERMPALRWGNQPGYPAPTWSIVLPQNWRELAGASGRPIVSAWVSNDDPPGHPLDFRRGDDLSKFTGREVQAGGSMNKIVIESVSLEDQDVETRPGAARTREKCLVVRLRYPKDMPAFVDIRGLQTVGKEHRFYLDANKYTGVFGPVGREDVLDKNWALHVISVPEFKESVGQRGKFELKLDRPERRGGGPQDFQSIMDRGDVNR